MRERAWRIRPNAPWPACPAAPGRDRKAPATHDTGKRRPQVRLYGLTGLVGYLIRQAQLWVFEDFNTTLAPLDIRPAQYSMLVVIQDNPGLSQMALSEMLGISRYGIIPPLDELQSRGCSSGRRHQTGGPHALHLTTEGEALARQCRQPCPAA